MWGVKELNGVRGVKTIPLTHRIDAEVRRDWCGVKELNGVRGVETTPFTLASLLNIIFHFFPSATSVL